MELRNMKHLITGATGDVGSRVVAHLLKRNIRPCVLVRSGQQPVVVNLDIPAVEADPEQVHWVDNIHPAPSK